MPKLKEPKQPSPKLEDCEPGAPGDEVLQFIEKMAMSPKPSRKRGEPPVLNRLKHVNQ